MAGVAVSLLLHAALLHMLYAPTRKEMVPDAPRMMVWLLPKPLHRPSPPLLLPTPSVPPISAKRAQRPAASALPSTQAIPATNNASVAFPAVDADQHATKSADIPPDPFASAPAPVKGKFDVNAAMESARKLATAKSTKDDPAVAQIYDKPLYGLPGDTPLGTAVSRTARGDCKSIAQGTGILALIIVPVMILTDKKDSGCKW